MLGERNLLRNLAASFVAADSFGEKCMIGVRVLIGTVLHFKGIWGISR